MRRSDWHRRFVVRSEFRPALCLHEDALATTESVLDDKGQLEQVHVVPIEDLVIHGRRRYKNFADFTVHTNGKIVDSPGHATIDALATTESVLDDKGQARLRGGTGLAGIHSALQSVGASRYASSEFRPRLHPARNRRLQLRQVVVCPGYLRIPLLQFQ